MRIQAILLSRRLKIEGLLSTNDNRRYFLLELPDYFLFNPIKKFIALCQLTAMSISGGFGKKIKGLGQTFLCLNLAHIIASDGHSSGQRPPVLSRAFEEASRIIGRENAWRMVSETPLAIIEGKSIEIPVPYPTPSQRYGRNRRNRGDERSRRNERQNADVSHFSHFPLLSQVLDQIDRTDQMNDA